MNGTSWPNISTPTKNNIQYNHIYIFKNTLLLQIIVMSIFSALGVFGNFLVLVTGVRKLSKLFRVPTVGSNQDCKTLFIANLAIADILTLANGVPLHLIVDNAIPISDFVCRFIWPLKDVFWYVSILTIMAISIERAVAIVNPFALKTTQRHTKHGILMIWITAYLVGGLPMIFVTRNVRYCETIYPSQKLQTLHQAMATVMTIIPGTVTTICYALCWRSLCKFRKRHKSAITANNTNIEQWTFVEQSRNLSRIAVILVVVYWFCNLPFLIYAICINNKFFSQSVTSSFYTRAVLLCLFFSASAINPVVLIVMSPVYRRGSVGCLSYWFTKRKPIFLNSRSARTQSVSRHPTSKSDQTSIANELPMGSLLGSTCQTQMN